MGVKRVGNYRGAKVGREHRAMPKSMQSPSVLDIAWAAGLFEGEGSASACSRACIVQKDTYILRKLQVLFGGTIRRNGRGRDVFAWTICGGRARGFLYTIFTFLSPRRREQVKVALRELKYA